MDEPPMVNLVLKFVSACRASGLRVSTAEILDAVRQFELIDFLDENQFRGTLRANLAKSRREQKHFDELYALFFHDMQPAQSVDDLKNTRPRQIQEILDRLNRDMENDSINRAILDFLAGDPIPYLDRMQQVENQTEYTSKTLKSNLGQLSSRLEVMLRLNKIRNQLLALQEEAGEEASGGQEGVSRLLHRLNLALAMLSQDSRPYNDGLKQVKIHNRHYDDLGERPFASLTEKEVNEMRAVINHLVRKMKDIMSRRYAAKNRGSLDVKKTLRHAGRFQGVPMEIKYRNRPLRKTRIVTLCDVSGSVWSAARFMLNMIYSMQDCFTDVKSFAFVCGPTNITDIFENNEPAEAVEKVLTTTEINFGALTDYGEMFAGFCRSSFHLLTQKTTLIILGDGRSNYHNPREQLLADIRAKCRRVIWLNPEPEQFWGSGDSEMNTYRAYCHEVRPCRNLNQLIDFIQDLVL